MSHIRIFFGLLALVIVTQAFTLREKRKAQDWPSSASSSSSSSSGGPDGPITKTLTHVIGHGQADASGLAVGFGHNPHSSGPYLPGGPSGSGGSGNQWQNNQGGNQWGSGSFPQQSGQPGESGYQQQIGQLGEPSTSQQAGQPGGPGYPQQPSQPSGFGYPQQPGKPGGPGYPQPPGHSSYPSYGGSGSAFATANSYGGNANTAANAVSSGAAPYNPHPHGGEQGNANAIANANSHDGNANAIANANSYGGNANAIANANANGGGFRGPFLSRFGEDDEDNTKSEGNVEDTKGVFSTSHASLDKDGKSKFDMAAGKIPQ